MFWPQMIKLPPQDRKLADKDGSLHGQKNWSQSKLSLMKKDQAIWLLSKSAKFN